MSEFNFANYYQEIFAGEKNLTQYEAINYLFWGKKYEDGSQFIHESTISSYVNGNKPISKTHKEEIFASSDIELANRFSFLHIQNINKLAKKAKKFVENSNAEIELKNELAGAYNKYLNEPEMFLGLVLKETVKWKKQKAKKNENEDKTKEEIDYFELYNKLTEENQNYSDKFRVLQSLGIIDCTEELKTSAYAPKACIPEIVRSFDFMGIGGEKWVKNKDEDEDDDKVDILECFESMLLRTDSFRGKVRFLIIDPECKEYKKLYKLREKSLPTESYDIFLDLLDRYDNLEVRLYSHFPTFRMQFVDNKYLAISRYYFDKNIHDDSEGGWKTPHLIIVNEVAQINDKELYKGSLYGSFVMAFNYYWEQNTRDIREWAKAGKKFNRGKIKDEQ